MRKSSTFFFFTIIIIFKSYGQIDPADKHILDSLLKYDVLLKMINQLGKPSSYFRINAGIGNRLFSDGNRAIEALQSNKQLVITPSISYFHKSGLGISFAGYLLSENSRLDFYQYALSPSYSYSAGKVINGSLYYTHYFKKDLYNLSGSPINDEWYGNVIFKKPWLRPGISLGYANGRYKEIVNIDTTFKIRNQPVTIRYIDTITTKISSLSFSGTLEHDFNFYSVLSKKDGLRLTPQFSLIAGLNSYSINYNSSATLFNLYSKKKLKKQGKFQTQQNQQDTHDTTRFEIQSLGFDIDLTYAIGKFYIEPELYLDYYLPKTNDKRLTQIFNFNIGITF